MGPIHRSRSERVLCPIYPLQSESLKKYWPLAPVKYHQVAIYFVVIRLLKHRFEIQNIRTFTSPQIA